MNNLVFSAIAGITSFVKSLRFKQAIITVLAGFFLLTSTACSGPSNATSARSYDYNAAPSTNGVNERTAKTSSPYGKASGTQRELYNPTQSQKGGMNNYNDDPAYNTNNDVNAKAQRLINKAENRLQNRAESPQEALENARESNPFGQGAKDVSRRFENSAEQARENLTEGTQQGFRNLKSNVDKARQETPNVVERARQSALEATEGLREGAEDVSESAQRAVGRAANEAEYRTQDAASAIRDRG